MKRMILSAVLGLLALLPVFGQPKVEFQIDSVFTTCYPKAKTLMVKGHSLHDYKLDWFRSIKFKACEADFEQLEKWIRNDVPGASESDLEMDGDRLVYALLRFNDGRSKRNSYVGYHCKTTSDGPYVTVVRMSGKASTDELKFFFKQK